MFIAQNNDWAPSYIKPEDLVTYLSLQAVLGGCGSVTALSRVGLLAVAGVRGLLYIPPSTEPPRDGLLSGAPYGDASSGKRQGSDLLLDSVR